MNDRKNMNLIEPMKKRGGFLIIMILTLVVGDIQIPYYLANPSAISSVYGNLPAWYSLYAVSGLVLSIAIIIGMWRMKKWAAYVLILYFTSKVPTEFFIFQPTQQMVVVATTVAGAGLWFWAIYRKWKLFD
jgi:uncharacterized membrane protein